jgi:Sec-independent protein translocase protein TatA
MEKADFGAVLEALDSMGAMIQKIRDMLPGDSAEEQSSEVDEATEEGETKAVGDESLKPSDSADKDMKKAAAVAMIKKQLG